MNIEELEKIILDLRDLTFEYEHNLMGDESSLLSGRSVYIRDRIKADYQQSIKTLCKGYLEIYETT
jgi:hypothetical protein